MLADVGAVGSAVFPPLGGFFSFFGRVYHGLTPVEEQITALNAQFAQVLEAVKAVSGKVA